MNIWLDTFMNHLLKDTLGPVNCLHFAQAINDCVVGHNSRRNPSVIHFMKKQLKRLLNSLFIA